MNKKAFIFVSTTLFFIFLLYSTPLTFAQRHWDYCKVSAYARNANMMETGDIIYIEFYVDAPPSESEITNTLYVINYDTGENYTKNLGVNDFVNVRWDGYNPDEFIFEPAGDSVHTTFYFEGEVYNVALNHTDIPEFSPFLIVPLFIIATLLILVYRKKRTSQN